MHVYLTRLKVIFRTKSLIFWTLIFPIILGTLFNMAFSNLDASEKFDPINVGIVQDENYEKDTGFDNLIKSLSKGENKIFNTNYYRNKSEATKALKDNKIIGYYYNNEKINMVVKTNGINETIMKYISDKYYEYYIVSNNLINIKNKDFKIEMLDNLNSNKTYIKEKPINNLNMTVLYFYSLIGMVCLYGGFFGVDAVNVSEANLSKKGARLVVAPTNKLKNLLSSLLAGYTIQVIEVFIIFLYLIYVLNIDFGNSIPLIILMLLVGSFAGITMGTFIGVSNKKDENTKSGIVLSITMLCSFLSGMMMSEMKYIIANNLPLLALINPVNMITDGLYSLYYYDDLTRFNTNIISLLIFSLIMIIGSFMFVRRKKYDSI